MKIFRTKKIILLLFKEPIFATRSSANMINEKERRDAVREAAIKKIK